MHRPTDPITSPIRARIHERALSRVTKLFNAGLGDIFAELFQNARRGGAQRIDVTVKRIPAQFEGDRRVTVTDDGAGIADPAVLLSFGESGWDAGTAEREDAAGMGLLSLARRGCIVRSRVRSEGAQPGWRLLLTPDHFLGCDDAQAVPDDEAPSPQGTAIAFVAHETAEAIQAAVAGAARYAPLPVTFDGKAVPQQSFLDGACHTERWAGLTLGVFKNRHDPFNQPDLNFHGLTLNVRLPRIQTLDGGTWSARAEVESCPELELVLPARKEAVETPFLSTLREAVREPIYHALAVADPAPRVAFEDHRDAARAGIPLPVPPAELRPWGPATADVDDWREARPFTPIADDALVMAYDPDPPKAQALYRAAEQAGLHRRLFEADKRLEGYPWYDALTRVGNLRVEITTADAVRWLDTLRSTSPGAAALPSTADTPMRPEAIRMHLELARADQSQAPMSIPADVVFLGEAYTWVGDAHPLVTVDSAIEPETLARLLRDGFFSPSDDAAADAWETQSIRFDEEALHIALKLLSSEDEARRRTIAQAVWREILWLMPKDRAVDIAIRNGDVAVTLGPLAGR